MTRLGRRLMQALAPGLLSCLASLAQADVDSQITSPRLKQLAAAVATADTAATDSFWRAIDEARTPLVEPLDGTTADVQMTFLWRAQPGQDELNVRVFAIGLSEWGQVGDALQRLGKTDVWYRTYRVPDRARFTYFLAWPQGTTPRADALRIPAQNGIVYEGVADPRARSTYRSEFEEASRLYSYAEGPAAPAEPFVAVRQDVPRGDVETIEVESKILANRRKVSIYTPPGYRKSGTPYGLLLLSDRKSYLSVVPTPTILDNMLADEVIPPLVAVLIDSRVTNDPDGDARSRELPPNPKYQRFLREELMPLIRARYHVSADPTRNVVAGSSFGGLAAAFTGLSSPDVFGNVLSQSGSYWWYPSCCRSTSGIPVLLVEDSGWLIKELAAAPRKQLRFYMDVGLWEKVDMLMPNRILRSVLEGKGYEVTYREFAGGHDYLSWRGTLSDGLIALIGTKQARRELTRLER